MVNNEKIICKTYFLYYNLLENIFNLVGFIIGLIIGGLFLLDKFFNSDMWPKTIEFVEIIMLLRLKAHFKYFNLL